MNKIIPAYLFICFSITILTSQKSYGQPAIQDKIEIGTRNSIYSVILNEKRNFWLYLPPEYTNNTYAPASYPVIYLLDGDANFHSLTGIVQYLSKYPYPLMPQAIVVGVIHSDRTRELTPTGAAREAYYDKNVALYKNSGGNKLFTDFLEHELIPHIDSTYRTTPYRILIGHSFGGLAAVNTLLNRKQLFNAYVAIDPSMWWDNQVLIGQAKATLNKSDFSSKVLFAARANKTVIPQDTSTDMQCSNISFEKVLAQSHGNLQWKYKYYENEDHGSISVPAAYDALKFIFNGYQLQVKSVAENPALVMQSYCNLSERLGSPLLPAESYLDWLGNYCLNLGKTAQALEFYQLNLRLYPQSPNVYSAIAKAYEKNGDTAKADLYQKKALKW